MRYLKHIVTAVIAFIALASCKSQYEMLLEGNNVEAKYKAAFEYFNAGKYQKAASLFESLSFLTTGTSQDDTVQYYWGLSNYKFKDFVTAESNFDHFITNFPRSPFTSDAKFLKLDCLYRETLRYELDQTPTYKALAAIAEYMNEYPDSDKIPICVKMIDELGERLDKKDFENAKLYYKMEDYKASRVALKNVLKEDADNMYREDILYYIAMSSYKYADMSVKQKQKERYLQFVDDYLNFIGEYPESGYRAELDALYKKVKEIN